MSTKVIDEATEQRFPDTLDDRLRRALEKRMNITTPTLIQSKVIQLAMEGKDVVGKARTGSGKTLAYCLPLVQKLLTNASIILYNILIF